MQAMQDVQFYTYFFHRDYTCICQDIHKMQEIKEDCD